MRLVIVIAAVCAALTVSASSLGPAGATTTVPSPNDYYWSAQYGGFGFLCAQQTDYVNHYYGSGWHTQMDTHSTYNLYCAGGDLARDAGLLYASSKVQRSDGTYCSGTATAANLQGTAHTYGGGAGFCGIPASGSKRGVFYHSAVLYNFTEYSDMTPFHCANGDFDCS